MLPYFAVCCSFQTCFNVTKYSCMTSLPVLLQAVAQDVEVEDEDDEEEMRQRLAALNS